MTIEELDTKMTHIDKEIEDIRAEISTMGGVRGCVRMYVRGLGEILDWVFKPFIETL
jgi:hypothetical protein